MLFSPTLKSGVRAGLLCTAFGVALATAAPASALYQYDPDLVVPLNGFSTNQDPWVQHPLGELAFSFLQNGDNSCMAGICLDLRVTNATPTVLNGEGVISSYMVAAGFDLPTTLAGFAYSSWNSDTSGLYSQSNPNAFTNLSAPGSVGNASFDLCPSSVNSCQSGGGPGDGLANDGEFTIVRFLFNNPNAISKADIVDAFEALYSNIPLPPYTGNTLADFPVYGRWQAVDYAFECTSEYVALGGCQPSELGTLVTRRGESDKIAGGTPDDPGPTPDSVPGPLPVVGAAAAFGFSRKLRRRIAAGKPRMIYTL